jgi:hypothetical protein
MTFEAIVEEIQTLSVEERKALITVIVDSLTEPLATTRTRSILEFEGIGERLRDDIDPQEYINQLRSEWDHRP